MLMLKHLTCRISTKHIILSWKTLDSDPITILTILEQNVWYNKYIQIENLPIQILFPFDLFIYDLYTIVVWFYDDFIMIV